MSTHRSGDPSLAVPKDSPKGYPPFTDRLAERDFLKQRLALGFRVMAKCGFAEGVAGHITLRDPVDPTAFWVNPFGLHFSLITAEDLILVSHDGMVLEGGRNRQLNFAAFAIHSEIHSARKDVLCAAHTHSTYGRAFCATGRTLSMLTQDFCTFYKDHVLYKNFAGLVLDSQEGKEIADCLRHNKAALLGNHGLLTVGQTVEEAIHLFVLLDRCCQIQLAADASSAGSGEPLVTIGDAEAVSTHAAIGNSETLYFSALPLFQVAEKDFGGERTYLGRGLEPHGT